MLQEQKKDEAEESLKILWRLLHECSAAITCSALCTIQTSQQPEKGKATMNDDGMQQEQVL